MSVVLLLGDSLTVGVGSTVIDPSWKDACGGQGLTNGFRKSLADSTPGNSYVGPCGRAPYKHAGVGGATSADWTPTGQYGAQLPGWITKYAPTRVHLMIGTNDVIAVNAGKDTIGNAADRVGIFLKTFAFDYPKINFSIGTIPYFKGGKDSALNTLVDSYNVSLANTAKAVSSDPKTQVMLVDGCAPYDQALLTGAAVVTADGTHPNDAGYALLARGLIPPFGGTVPASGTGSSASPDSGQDCISPTSNGLVGPMTWTTGPGGEVVTREQDGKGTPEVLVFCQVDANTFQKNVVTPWRSIADAKVQKYGLPTYFSAYVLAIVNAESGGDPRAFRQEPPSDACPSGCTGIGLGQLTDPGIKGSYTDEQLYDPDLNIDLTTKAIALQLKRYGASLPKIASAYNCGSASASPGTLWGLCAASQSYLTKIVLAANTFLLRNQGVSTGAKSEGNTLVVGTALAGVAAFIVVPWRKIFRRG